MFQFGKIMNKATKIFLKGLNKQLIFKTQFQNKLLIDKLPSSKNKAQGK